MIFRVELAALDGLGDVLERVQPNRFQRGDDVAHVELARLTHGREDIFVPIDADKPARYGIVGDRVRIHRVDQVAVLLREPFAQPIHFNASSE